MQSQDDVLMYFRKNREDEEEVVKVNGCIRIED